MRVAGSALVVFHINIPGFLGNMTTSAVTSFEQIVDNKDRLKRAGINYKDTLSPQLITDSHQKEAMEELLSSTDSHQKEAMEEPLSSAGASNVRHDFEVENGRTIRVCNHCHGCLQGNVPIDLTNYLMLSQYTYLSKRDPEVEVTLHNSMTVEVLTKTFSTQSKTHKIIIRIEPAYFETRTEGAPRNSIVHMFNELGRALKRQKALTHLEIHGNSADGGVFVGLRAVLKCRSLQTLHVSGIPCFLQEKNITIKCRRLKNFTIEGVLVNTKPAVSNIVAMRRTSSILTSIRVDIGPIP
ncbi:MAG: hypothetical protein J3Q66DRAFT_375011 [Benniella sp.]|nr:MAG: hypothetical protein J3Q66DRAFT_375011 [Benniella sp.]